MNRRAAACAAAFAIAFASVVDNAACCPDEAERSSLPGAPPTPSSACAEMPCQTPGVLTALVWPTPVTLLRTAITDPVFEPVSADAPAPPTPPPTAARA
jgi:hypothetical protein